MLPYFDCSNFKNLKEWWMLASSSRTRSQVAPNLKLRTHRGGGGWGIPPLASLSGFAIENQRVAALQN